MRIAILIDRLSPGATPKCAGEEIRYLRSLGHDAELVAIMDGGLPEGDYRFQDYLNGVPIRYLCREFSLFRRLDIRIPPFVFFSMYHLAALVLTPRILKKDTKRYDVIIAYASDACLVAERLRKRLGIPYIAILWDPISYLMERVYTQRFPRPLLSILKRVGEHFDRVIIRNSAVSLAAASPQVEMINSLDNGKKGQVVYLGNHPLEKTPEKRGDFILSIDRWDEGAMPHTLLDVWQRLKHKMELRIAGFWLPESLRQSFLKMRDEKGLTEWVKVLGPVSETELNELYLNARTMVYPRSETFNMSVVEAAGHGCTIVMPGKTEPFTHNLNGLFSPDDDLDKFAEYVDALITDERLAWKLGQEGWKVAKANSWQAHSKKMADLCEKYAGS